MSYKSDCKDRNLEIKCGEIYVDKHEKKIILKCAHCDNQFLSLKTFSKHIFNHLDDELHTTDDSNCKLNENHCTTKDTLADPISYNEESCEVQCSIQSKEERSKSEHFSIRDKLANEENLKYKKSEKKNNKDILEGYFQCTVCLELLRKDTRLKHLKTHQHIKKFICETCGKGCRDNYQLVQHIKNHTGERPFKCQFCLNSFKSKHTLKNHERSHLDYKPFKCNICDALFKSKRAVQQHELRHLKPVERNFECDLCGKKFGTNTSMVDHRSRHKQEKKPKPFQCPKCPKSFQSKYACTAHDRLEHKGEYNYKCNFCDKLFIKIAMKKVHEATHTRIGQPFLCNLCPKKYATREGLYKHKKRDHISNKPTPDFKCCKCNDIFKLQSEYADHCRKHVSEEYQYICTDCGANFINETKLKNHINIIHMTEES